MPAIREGSILVNTAILDFKVISRILMDLCTVDTNLTYTIEPGYGVVVFLHSKSLSAKYTAIPPHTLVFSSRQDDEIQDLCSESRTCMKLVRPTWIKTWTIKPCTLLTFLSTLTNRELPRLELGGKTVIAMEGDIDCDSIYVIEGIYRYNYSWFIGRILFYDKKYKTILQKHVELRKEIVPFVYSGMKPIAYMDRDGLKLIVNTRCLDTLVRLYFHVLLDYIALLGF